MINLEGKIALITGSSDGIGAATARLFSSLGAKVVIVGRTRSKLDQVAAQCEAKSPHGYKPVIIEANFERDEDVKRTFEETIAAHGKLDILVNNAGVVGMKKLDDPDLMEDFDWMMQVNVRAVMQLTKLAKGHLVRSKGAVVNVSSTAGIRMSALAWPYCMTKAALDMFTKSMACVLAPDVRVNSVNPGPVRTSLLRKWADSEVFWNMMDASMPLKKIGDPADIAKTIAFLASDAAANMTGSIVVSDSGSLVLDPSMNLSLTEDENKQG